MIEVGVAAAGGGLFGLLGSVAGRVAGYFEKRQEYLHERQRWAHEAALFDLQMQARAQETEAEIALSDTRGSWDGLSASLRADAAAPASYPWVNAVRALTRPVLTLTLWGLAGLIFLAADDAGRSGIVESTVFAATAATLWWFGDRGVNRRRTRDG